jgi:hypothetical protein
MLAASRSLTLALSRSRSLSRALCLPHETESVDLEPLTPRSTGENGRSLADVLMDTIEFIRGVTSRERQTKPTQPPPASTDPAKSLWAGGGGDAELNAYMQN